MVAQKFSECFWNKEFNSNAGFDILLKKMKDGRTSSKEIISFVKERSKLEEDYAKSLMRLSRSSLGSTDSGTFKRILTELKKDVEKSAGVHLDMSQALVEQAQRMQVFKDDFTARCKQAEGDMKKWQASKKDLYHKTQSSQQVYQKKCVSYETAHHTYVTEKSSATKQTKEIEKLENRSHKCKEEKMKADELYQAAVKNLETVRGHWEVEMQKTCDLFQQVEDDRLKFFRNELWVFVNIDSKTLCDQDEKNQEVRNVMEGSDPEKDIEDFINASKTGCARPAPVLYDCFDSKPSSAAQITTTLGSNFFASDARQLPSCPGSLDDYTDPTYASVS